MSRCKKINRTNIGGQAVIEGVMMRGKKSIATAVRDNDGIVRLETSRISQTKKRPLFLRLPIIRGIINFVMMLVVGVKTLLRSAEVFGEQEPTKFEKFLSKKFKINLTSVLTVISVIFAVILALAMFVLLPSAILTGIIKLFKLQGIHPILKNLIDGLLKVMLFILYVVIVSLFKDIKRTFMYHGAEHKVISCFEYGKELTVENVKSSSRFHDRCGTTFIFFVVIVSILLFSLTGYNGNMWGRVGIKLLLLPLVMGISYEFLKLLAKTDCIVVYPFKLPGLLLQRLTTKEPTDDMIEVALTAFNTVLKMDEDESIRTVRFVTAEKLSKLLARLKEEALAEGIEDPADIEWIACRVLNERRSNLKNDRIIYPKDVEKILEFMKERLTRKPLWYIFGDTEFYGNTIKVNENVLIPRMETEILAEKSIKCLHADDTVLELCTGSGAVAIAIKKETGVKVVASDISEEALEVARDNAELNEVDIDFIQSDYFSAFKGQKFSMIVANPPYIKSGDIPLLQDEVKDFEPHLALDGGEDGLDAYRIIIRDAIKYLNDDGTLILEIGEGQSYEILRMLKKFTSIAVYKDFNGIDRIIKAEL